MRSWMSLPLILVVVVIIRSLPVPGSQFHNEAPAITFQPYNYFIPLNVSTLNIVRLVEMSVSIRSVILLVQHFCII